MIRPVAFSDIPGWGRDDPGKALEAFARCAAHVSEAKSYRVGSLGVSCADFAVAYEAALVAPPGKPSDNRAFFESLFRPVRVDPVGGGPPGFVTGFYEPEISVDERPGPAFRHPFYRRPDDLVDIDETVRPPALGPDYAFALRTADGLRPYPDRAAIDSGCLHGRGLEIAYAEDKVDVFFAHVQGAARLRFRDGSVRRITYSAKAGHPFTGIGGILAERGEIDPSRVTMTSIREWLKAHPDRVDEILHCNRSYIFFRETEADHPSLGPIAAAKVPLSPGRSLAVDRTIHTFSTPFFVDAPSLTHLDGGRPFRRLMIAQDTGSAIVGPARGDIFVGSGTAAGELAGRVRHEAVFYALLPSAAFERVVAS